jgi:hypothetical protein
MTQSNGETLPNEACPNPTQYGMYFDLNDPFYGRW